MFDNDQIGQLAHIVERTASEDEVNSNDDDEPDELRSYLLQYEGVRNLRELSVERIEELLAMIQNERERIQAQQMNTRREGGIRITDEVEMQMRAQDEMQQALWVSEQYEEDERARLEDEMQHAQLDAEQEEEDERTRLEDEMQQAQWESEQYAEIERARRRQEMQQALWVSEQEEEDERTRLEDEMQQAQWESEQYEEEERARREEELQQALWVSEQYETDLDESHNDN